MDIETKTIRDEDEIDACCAFGWEITEQTEERYRSGRLHHTRTIYILARDRNMPNYDILCAYEQKYYSLENKLETIPEKDPALGFFLFILCIFPLIIYLIVMNAKINKVKNYNSEIREQMMEVLMEARKYL